MSSSTSTEPGRSHGHPAVQRVPERRRLDAAMRLISGAAGDRRLAARRFLRNGAEHGIDHSLMWATFSPRGHAREVCLVVIGSGRTATLFLAPPEADQEAAARVEERAAVIETACRWLASERAQAVRLAQYLPDPTEAWAIEACLEAGFERISTLSYLARPMAAPPEPGPLPEGVRFRRVDELGDESTWQPVLAETLEASYERTLDCPELCGMRDTRDVIASHKSVGRWDPALWWLVYDGDRARGCALLNECIEQRSIELVYLGLAPALRGCGLGRSLLEHALHAVAARPVERVTCAVDDRNQPALHLYADLGFSPFAHRAAMVRRIGRDR